MRWRVGGCCGCDTDLTPDCCADCTGHLPLHGTLSIASNDLFGDITMSLTPAAIADSLAEGAANIGNGFQFLESNYGDCSRRGIYYLDGDAWESQGLLDEPEYEFFWDSDDLDWAEGRPPTWPVNAGPKLNAQLLWAKNYDNTSGLTLWMQIWGSGSDAPWEDNEVWTGQVLPISKDCLGPYTATLSPLRGEVEIEVTVDMTGETSPTKWLDDDTAYNGVVSPTDIDLHLSPSFINNTQWPVTIHDASDRSGYSATAPDQGAYDYGWIQGIFVDTQTYIHFLGVSPISGSTFEAYNPLEATTLELLAFYDPSFSGPTPDDTVLAGNELIFPPAGSPQSDFYIDASTGQFYYTIPVDEVPNSISSQGDPSTSPKPTQPRCRTDGIYAAMGIYGGRETFYGGEKDESKDFLGVTAYRQIHSFDVTMHHELSLAFYGNEVVLRLYFTGSGSQTKQWVAFSGTYGEWVYVKDLGAERSIKYLILEGDDSRSSGPSQTGQIVVGFHETESAPTNFGAIQQALPAFTQDADD